MTTVAAPDTPAIRPRGLPKCSRRALIVAALCLGGSILLSGCATAVERGHSVALDGADLVKMTDHMAMQIAGSPAVQREIDQHGPMRVVVEPVENLMRAEVLPRGPAEAFTARVRALLSQKAPDQFVWIMNRDAYYRLREQELDVDLGPAPEAMNPQYALVARFRSLADEDHRRRTAYYLCTYELTDLERRRVLWTGTYEVEKVAVKGFLD